MILRLWYHSRPMLEPFSSLFSAADLPTPIRRWLRTLPSQMQQALLRHGNYERWQAAVDALPFRPQVDIDLSAECLRIGSAQDLDAAGREQVEQQLQALHPWRKGPFCLFGVHLDTEWHSDWKWQRVAPHLSPLTGRTVLDVGCGNGYYGWRMLGAGAKRVIGLDPTIVFVMQWLAIRRWAGDRPLHVLPLGVEALADGVATFDTVFSMGVLYHRRDPLEHLRQLRGSLREGGEVVLETLVIDAAQGEFLVPPGRYAKMKNVWAVPAPGTVEQWMQQAGFRNVRCVDITPTTVEEQRATAWMRFESLVDFLDPDDHRRTVEGHPAPIRAVFIAER